MHNNWLRVEGEQYLYKDPMSNGVIDTNTEAYERHLAVKKQRLSEKNRIERLETRINKVDTELSEIKNLLTRLLERSNGHNN